MPCIGRLWTGYWFRPAPLLDLAICRIACVALQLYLLIEIHHFNTERLLLLSTLPDSWYAPLPVLRLVISPWGSTFRPPVELLLAVYWLTVASGILALIGFITNGSLLLFALGNIVLQAFSYSFSELHHGSALMMIALSILALSPAGRALSVDALWRRARPHVRWRRLNVFGPGGEESVLARWPLILIRHMLALIYLDAALHKLNRAGLDWMNGHTLQFYLVHDAVPRGSDIGVWLAQQHTLAWLLSWVTIVFELTFFLVLLAPRLAWAYIPVGIALHIGMCVTNVACFYQFLALYTVFVPWALLFKPLPHHWVFLRARGGSSLVGQPRRGVDTSVPQSRS
jgi:hypothetical protein